MKSRKLNLFVLAAFCLGLITVALPVFSYAQDDEAVYTRRYSRRDVGSTIARLEQSSNTFRRDFDRYLDESNINGTNDEVRINRIVQNFERALNTLRRDFDASNNWWQTRNQVRNVMDESRQLNNMMNNISFARRLERQWNQMRRDINKLADTYNLPNLSGGGGGGDGGGGGGGGGRGNAPSWAVGTFYGRNPQTGGTITLNINSRGAVTITFENGMTEYATMNNDRLNNNGIISRVTRITNGIRTTRVDNGERIDYFISGNNTGDGGGGGDVPSWAIGRFYGRNPQTGGTITLDISRDGSVVITFENGATNYATMDGDRLNNGGIVSRVTRINNGIRTTRVDNGERIDYRR
jgi:hypothetical protein